MSPTTEAPVEIRLGPTPWDKMFLVLLLLVLASVVGVGRLAFVEGMKNEAGKQNVERWAAWFEKASAERFNEGFEPSACAGGDAASGNTWAGCLPVLMVSPHPLAVTRNPFSQQTINFAGKCEPGNRTLAGALIIEKILPTAPGSPLPSYPSPLAESDAIGQKMQLRLTVCDQGGYPGRPTEVTF